MDGVGALSEKEKQTLRLLLRGHDAKSSARALGLSVHTVNERLRDARRKLAIGSSREAARLLLAHEGATPDLSGDSAIGEAGQVPAVAATTGPENGGGRFRRTVIIASGVLAMSLFLVLAALIATPQASAPPPAIAEAGDADVLAVAQSWLALLDASRWTDSYARTGAAFRKLNTAARWAAASERVRVPLGAVKIRTLLSHDDVPAPPSGFDMVRFRTDFANKAGAVETVTLDRENGTWRVVGVTVG